MKQGERKWLYRSCRHLIAIIFLASGAAARAQITDPLAITPHEHALSRGVSEGRDVSRHTGGYGKLAARTDSIVPGKRDFLEPNVPNPFGSGSGSTKISYSISEESHVQLRVYDFYYKQVAVLVDSIQSAGYYTVPFSPEGAIASGMYFYELKTDRTRELRRMMYVK
jgi:hypothetical protein